LLLLFAGRLYSRINSFPFRLRLYALVLSLLTEIVCLHFVRDQLFPFERDCSSVPLLKISFFHSKIFSFVLLSKISSFHSEISSFVLLLKISSFHSEIYSSVLLSKISSFHSKICSSVLLSKINSFLFGVCPSVLRQISTPSFLGFARLYFS